MRPPSTTCSPPHGRRHITNDNRRTRLTMESSQTADVGSDWKRQNSSSRIVDNIMGRLIGETEKNSSHN